LLAPAAPALEAATPVAAAVPSAVTTAPATKAHLLLM
jgi:hypothetical protein